MQFWLIGIVGEAKAGAEREGQVNGVVWKDCQEGVQLHVKTINAFLCFRGEELSSSQRRREQEES